MTTGAALVLAASIQAATVSGTALFESTLVVYVDDARICHKPARGVPPRRVVVAHARAIPEATRAFWGEDSGPWYRMAALLFSESGGHMGKNSPRTEPTYGPYCTSTAEVWAACSEFRWIPCPRTKAAIIDKLNGDPAWAALVAAATLRRYDREQGEDTVAGTLAYKMGTAGLARALCRDCLLPRVPCRNPVDLETWRALAAILDRLDCIRGRLIIGDPVRPCSCEPAP